MYEEDLKILDGQIERTQNKIKAAHNETAKYHYERNLKILLDMRLDLLIQIQNYKEQ